MRGQEQDMTWSISSAVENRELNGTSHGKKASEGERRKTSLTELCFLLRILCRYWLLRLGSGGRRVHPYCLIRQPGWVDSGYMGKWAWLSVCV